MKHSSISSSPNLSFVRRLLNGSFPGIVSPVYFEHIKKNIQIICPVLGIMVNNWKGSNIKQWYPQTFSRRGFILFCFKINWCSKKGSNDGLFYLARTSIISFGIWSFGRAFVSLEFYSSDTKSFIGTVDHLIHPTTHRVWNILLLHHWWVAVSSS